MGAIECLPIWNGGTMSIELDDNNVAFIPGSIISGKVYIFTEKIFPSDRLEIGLWATERGRFYRKKGANRNKIEMIEFFISDYLFTLEQFEKPLEGPGLGYFCYPF